MKTLSQSDYYITPPHILHAILEGINTTTDDFRIEFDMDPCPSARMPNGRFSVPADFLLEDGLKEDWHRECFKGETQYIFCNPPYSQKTAWIKKGIETLEKAQNKVCIFYLMPNSTDSEWYHIAPFSHEWHSRKRIRFIDPAKRYTEGVKPRNGTILGVMANYDNPPHNFYVGHPGTWSTHDKRSRVDDEGSILTIFNAEDMVEPPPEPITFTPNHEDQKFLDGFEHTPAGVTLFEG